MENDLSLISGRFGNQLNIIVTHLSSVGSTMDTVGLMGENGVSEGAIVVADAQTAGRGRHGRSWVSSKPADDLLFSMLFRPLPRLAYGVQILGSLAIAYVVERMTGKQTTIKWPNDVLIDGRKIAGILVESRQKGSECYSVLGIGINVNSKTDSYRDTGIHAISLMEICDRTLSRKKLLHRLVSEIAVLYDNLTAGETLLDRWREKLITLGDYVKTVVVTGSEESIIEGFAEDVDVFGRLLIRDNTGLLRALSSGEATLSEYTEQKIKGICKP